MSKSHLITGARVILYVNGKPYTKVTSFSFNSTTGRREIYGIDSAEPYELAPTTSQCQGQIGIYRIMADGGAEGAGMVAPLPDLTLEKYFTLALVERTTDTIIFSANQCSAVSQAWDIPSRGFVTGSIAFKAIEWSNEIRPRTGSK